MKKSPTCLKLLMNFSLKIVEGNKLFDAKKLLEAGLITLARDNVNEIIPYKFNFDESNRDYVYIKCGQLNSDNKIIGIGRKIRLNPKYYNDIIVDFYDSETFIEEG